MIHFEQRKISRKFSMLAVENIKVEMFLHKGIDTRRKDGREGKGRH